jgi:hypothetical protein
MIFFFQKLKIYWNFLSWAEKSHNIPSVNHFYFWLLWVTDKQKSLK